MNNLKHLNDLINIGESKLIGMNYSFNALITNEVKDIEVIITKDIVDEVLIKEIAREARNLFMGDTKKVPVKITSRDVYE